MNNDIRDVFFDELYKDALIDESIVVITADADAFGLRKFKKDIPDRFINIGITEQNMINVASGLALRGKKVYVYGIIQFVTMRCYEQIKFNLSGMNLPVTIIGVGTGFSFAFDGPSHHGIHDIAIMSQIPNMTILNPIDEYSTKMAYHISKTSTCPSYVRLDKGGFEHIYTESDVYSYKYINGGESNVESDILILTTGYTSHLAMKCIYAHPTINIVDIYKLKPFEFNIPSHIKKILVFEENCNGLSSIINNKFVDNRSLYIKNISIPLSEHITYGSREYLLSLNNITIVNLIHTISEMVEM